MKKKLIILVMLCFSIFSLAAEQQEEKPLITIMDFETNQIAKTDMTIFLDFMSSYIIETDRFRVLERSQRETLLAELKFSLSGCTDESCQLEVGKMLSADYLILGSLGNISEKYIINMRIVGVSDGETLKTFSEEFDSMGDIIDATRRIVYSFLDVDMDLSELEKDSSIRMFQNNILEEYKELLKTVDEEAYYSWCDEKGYLELLNGSNNLEKLALLNEYLKDTQKKGFFANGSVLANFNSVNNLTMTVTVSGEDRSFTDTIYSTYGLGFGLSFPYVFENTFSLGIWGIGSLSLMTAQIANYSSGTEEADGINKALIDYAFGAMAGYGDCYRGMAVRAGLGFSSFLEDFSLALNLELNIKRFYLQFVYGSPFSAPGGYMLFGIGYSTVIE